MKLMIKTKKNGMPRVVLTAGGRALRFDGPEEDFNGPECALRGLIDFLKEKDPDAYKRLGDAFPEGLVNFRGEREF